MRRAESALYRKLAPYPLLRGPRPLPSWPNVPQIPYVFISKFETSPTRLHSKVLLTARVFELGVADSSSDGFFAGRGRQLLVFEAPGPISRLGCFPA